VRACVEPDAPSDTDAFSAKDSLQPPIQEASAFENQSQTMIYTLAAAAGRVLISACFLEREVLVVTGERFDFGGEGGGRGRRNNTG
jgi:hypothetical protein